MSTPFDSQAACARRLPWPSGESRMNRLTPSKLLLLVALVLGWNSVQAAVCDLDNDGDVDMADISAILDLRNMPASGPGDPADADGDGIITVLDARQCVLLCTLPRCASPTTSNTAPVADAGPDQSVFVGDTVQLDGSGSSDADGDALTFSWTLISVPAGSGAALSDPTAVDPTFVVDAAGTYVAELIVNDGQIDSPPDTVVITTANSAPVADAGPDQSVFVGDTVQLDGSGSSDVDGDPLTFSWSLISVPAGSGAALSDPSAVNPTFVADVSGTYVAELFVDDGFGPSAPSTVTITTANSAPVADAGPDQSVFVGDTVQLDGSGSSDVDGDPLTFSWSLTSVPAGSAAALSDPTAVMPTFVADVAGSYVAQLIVDDGSVQSLPDTVSISTLNSVPVADAGPDQSVFVGDTVQLDGSGSSDADGDPLTFSWSLTTAPGGSLAMLSDPTFPDPTFVADQPGPYVGQLIVNDGLASSAPDTVLVTADPVLVTVPDVVGLAQAAAESAIVAAGLVVGTISTANSSTVPAGDVISQNPLAGASVAAGSAVDLVVSLGPALVTVPDVVGLAQAAAESAIVAAGLTVGIITTQNSAVVPAGFVISQNPLAGASVVLGGAVDLQISLGPAVSNDILAPQLVLTLNQSPPVYAQAQAVQLDILAADNSGPPTVVFSVDGGATAPAVLPITTIDTSGFVAGSSHDVDVTASDAAGNSTTRTASFTIVDIADVIPPTVAITSPPRDTITNSAVPIVGTADDANLVSYELAYSRVGANAFVPFDGGTAPVVNGTLGTFDPSLLENGLYDIRLTALDTGGNQSIVQTVLGAEGQAKVGNFTIGFIDLSIPVAGVPIRISRTYDSRIKSSGHFGFGWRLEVTQGSYENNRTPGEGWQILPSGGFISLPCMRVNETANHVTEVRLSDAEVHRFKLAVSGPAILSGGCVATASFTALAGNLNSTLQILGSNQVFFQNGGNDVLDFDPGSPTFLQPYEPDRVRLTTPDGRQFDLNLHTGVDSIRDTNGNGIAISSNGITHTGGAGIGVAFARDAQGRITSITDPNGGVRTYAYDQFGDLVSYTNTEGDVTRFTYNSDHGLLDINDPRGLSPARNEYDADGRLVATVDANGNRVTYDHQIASNREVYTDRLGNIRTFQYDSDGNVTSQTDALGNTSSMTYNADGEPLTETDALGNTTTKTYDADGNRLTRTDALGNVQTTTYNSRGSPLTETDPLGNITTLAYDTSGDLVSETDPLGNTTTFTRDSAGNPLTQTDPLGNVTTRTYSSSGEELTVTDANGDTRSRTFDGNRNQTSETRMRTVGGTPVAEIASYTYDGEGRLRTTVDHAGNATTTIYDATGQIVSQTDRRGNTKQFTWDFEGRNTEIRYADGTTILNTYDLEGRKTTSTDRSGRTTQFAYDAAGRLLQTTHPDGAVESKTYDAVGQVLSETDANGNTTDFVWDAAGRMTRRTDAAGGVTAFTYDASGNKLSETDANGNTTSFTYDAKNQLVTTTFPDGTTNTFTYDANGNKLTETDQAGNTTRFAYDPVGNLIQVTDSLGQATVYAYDEVGNRTSITDANGNTTTFEYDHDGRVTSKTLPGGQTFTFTYDAEGNEIQSVDADGDTIISVYDVSNRLMQKTLPSGEVHTFSYTGTGKIASETDARGTTTYVYDAMDRLLQVTHPDLTVVSHTYDAAGNETSLTTPAGTTSYTYDVLNRLVSVTDPGAGVTSYTYDPVGNLLTQTSPNGVVATHTYDTLNRLTGIETRRSDTTLVESYAYTLGAVGNRTRVTEGSGRVVDYTYDALYRLIREDITDAVIGNSSLDYTYDPVGNRLTKVVNSVATVTYTYDSNDRVLTEGTTTYSYDANGNTLTRSVGAVVTAYGYDGLNRLRSVSSPVASIAYTYDPSGNRVGANVNGTQTDYLVDSNRDLAQVVEERDSLGNTLVRYDHGNDLIAQSRSGVTSYYHADGIGSTRVLTDSSETVTDTYTYDAFGRLLGSTGSTVNDYLFTGEQFDPNIGFYYLRARYYDPAIGRFTTADVFPADLFDPQTLHRYVYVKNNPVNFVDPTGQFFTMAGLMTSVSIGQILSAMQPTITTGLIIVAGIELFWRPGFNLRNKALTAMAIGPPGAEGWAAAFQMYNNAATLIQLGAFFIDSAVRINNIVQFGLGVKNLARAYQNIPRATLTSVQITRITRYTSVALRVETQGVSLLVRASRFTSITMVRAMSQSFADWSQVIFRSVGLLARLPRLF